MQIGREITFDYTDKNIKVKGWIYMFDEKTCYVVVGRKTKLNSLIIPKNTVFPFSINHINNLKYQDENT